LRIMFWKRNCANTMFPSEQSWCPAYTFCGQEVDGPICFQNSPIYC
jgi:hypothetical protein